MELREEAIFDEEAAVEELAKWYFRDKFIHINDLFKIDKPSQNTQKPP